MQETIPEPQDMDVWRPADHHQLSAHFTRGVRSILQAIHAGDVYQVNLAWEQTGIPIHDGIRTWLQLRKQNPALRGCYLRQGDVEILSNSPELFLHIDGTSRRATSIPIKGTVPCSGGEQAKEYLLDSQKERAELTMIVDLVRNDLGRVATPGSVHTSDRTLRRCGDLWHAEQTVQAQLKPGLDGVDAICAAFPPGSVTGAPKVRAMEVIRNLEVQPRGIYTGAIGWFSDGGSAHFNVAIRTATLHNGVGRFHVGAGIVADSQPDLEWDETLAKARAMAHCLDME
jgi:anthranilate/para-aminobenzoate synthase component I